MSLRAAQIVLRVASKEALREALDRALRRQKADPRGRRLVAALADGWATIVEEGRQGVDGGLARLLSEQLSTEALAVALDGASLQLDLRRFVDGEPRDLAQDAALRATPVADVEQLAWTALRELGVPASLRLLDGGSLRASDEDDAEGFEALLAEVAQPLPPAAATVAIRDARAVPAERREGDGPPAEPDLWVESAAGEQCALEIRSPPGLAVRRDVAEALAAIEEAHAQRLAAHLAGLSEGERISRISFGYRAEPAAELAPLLAEARAARPLLQRLTHAQGTGPLSHAGFTAACRAAVSQALPDTRVLRAHALRLEVQGADAGVSLRAPLAAAYAAYLRLPEEPEDPAAPVVAAVRALVAAEIRPLTSLPVEELLAGLLPSLALDEAAAVAGRATALLASPLRAALLHDDGDRIEEVSSAALAAAGLTFEAALTRAVANVEALTLAHPGGVSWFDLDEGRVVVLDFDDPAGAGRVLSPQARSALNALLGEPCLCAVPTRDSLLACSMLEPDAIRWVEQEAAHRAAEGPHALAATFLVLTRDSVAPSAAGALVPDLELDAAAEEVGSA